MLYVVAPFITTADHDTLRRLVVSLEFLTNAIPVLGISNVNTDDLMALNGRMLNTMIDQHIWDFDQLSKLYILFTGRLFKVTEHARDEVVTFIDTF